MHTVVELDLLQKQERIETIKFNFFPLFYPLTMVRYTPCFTSYFNECKVRVPQRKIFAINFRHFNFK